MSKDELCFRHAHEVKFLFAGVYGKIAEGKYAGFINKLLILMQKCYKI
jgi:hypothetical protein